MQYRKLSGLRIAWNEHFAEQGGEIDMDGVKSQISNFNTLNAKNGVNIQSKFDGNGVNVEINNNISQIILGKLDNPHK